MTSSIAAGGSGRSTSVIPAVPAASSVTTIAFIGHLPETRHPSQATIVEEDQLSKRVLLAGEQAGGQLGVGPAARRRGRSGHLNTRAATSPPQKSHHATGRDARTPRGRHPST